jgi:hypothetical protein
MPAPIGRRRNEEWGIGAAQTFFHRDGTWFNRLRAFLGALCDPSGYVMFESEEEYLNNPNVHVGVQTNVPEGICRLAKYQKML